MTYAIQLYFDPVTDANVRDLWQRFEQLGLTGHLHESAGRPHMTLAVYADLDVARSEQMLVDLARSRAPIPLTFAHLGCFLSPSAVAFLAPVVTGDLLQLHRMTHEEFGKVGTNAEALYLPGRWVPHCTIASHMEVRALPLVIEASQDLRLPLTSTTTEIGIVEVSPTVPLFSAELDAKL